jgi:dUTP pyrophosphatase
LRSGRVACVQVYNRVELKKNMIELQIKLLDEDLPMPRYQHEGDAGLDLSSRVDFALEPGARAMIPTGIAVAIPPGYAGFVLPRSGLASRHGIALVNSPGLVDSGYRGEMSIVMINTDKHETFHIKRGDRIAQLVIQKVEEVKLVGVAELDDTSRGEGGFGSTGRSDKRG